MMHAPEQRWFYKENIAAIVSWAAFAYIQQAAVIHHLGLTSWQSLLSAGSLLLFLGLFFYNQRQKQQQAPWLGLTAMWLCMSISAWLVPDGFAPGLGVLWVCLLPWFVPSRFLYWMLVPSLLPVLVVMALDGLTQSDVLMVLVCGTFQYFAMFAMSKAREENIAREELSRTHQQLIQAQSILAKQAADSERLRIARDLHDSLGHHLTGLVIQLQVATHQADDNLKPVLHSCQQQAKQLLQDIRYTVSHLRQPTQPHLALQLRALQPTLPDLTMELAIPADIPTDPLCHAVLFRVCQEALTNSRRHAKASACCIEVWQHQQQLMLRYRDNGRLATWPLIEGNGLQGMRERVEQAGGQLLFSQQQQHLQIDVSLPLSQPPVSETSVSETSV